LLAFLFSNSAATVFTLQGLHLLVKKLWSVWRLSFNVSDTRKCLTNFKNKVVLLKTSSTNISEAFRQFTM
jgi:hypothetical protein